MLRIRSLALMAGVSLLGSACGAPEAPETERSKLSWEEFQARAFQEPETGVYIYNGDEAAEGLEGLRSVWEQYYHGGDTGSLHGGLAVMYKSGRDVKWSDTQKLNLTYCVSTKFGTRYTQVVQAMADATAAWEAVSNVNYVHLSQYDSNCTASQTGVLFDVRPVNVFGLYLARAFFPDATRSSRNVLIDNSAFTSTTPNLTVTGILRHELGHTLGFRHEHTRPESGDCFEDNDWRALTAYDSSSVMHYPQCNGTGDWSLVMTSSDVAGAASLYGAP